MSDETTPVDGQYDAEQLTNDIADTLRDYLDENDLENNGVEVDAAHHELLMHHQPQAVAEQLRDAAQAYITEVSNDLGCDITYDMHIREYFNDHDGVQLDITNIEMDTEELEA